MTLKNNMILDSKAKDILLLCERKKISGRNIFCLRKYTMTNEWSDIQLMSSLNGRETHQLFLTASNTLQQTPNNYLNNQVEDNIWLEIAQQQDTVNSGVLFL